VFFLKSCFEHAVQSLEQFGLLFAETLIGPAEPTAKPPAGLSGLAVLRSLWKLLRHLMA
jgi:hypothetical protein